MNISEPTPGVCSKAGSMDLPRDMWAKVAGPYPARHVALVNKTLAGNASDVHTRVHKPAPTLATANMKGISSYVDLLESLQKHFQPQRWAAMSPFRHLNPHFAAQDEQARAERLGAARAAFLKVVDDMYANFEQSGQPFIAFFYQKAVEMSHAYRAGADRIMTPPGVRYSHLENRVPARGELQARDRIPDSTRLDANDVWKRPDCDLHVDWRFAFWTDGDNPNPPAESTAMGVNFLLYHPEDIGAPDYTFFTRIMNIQGDEELASPTIEAQASEGGPRIEVSMIDGTKYGIDTSFGILDELYAAPFAERHAPYKYPLYRAALEPGDVYGPAEPDEIVRPMVVRGGSVKLHKLALGVLLLGFCQVRQVQPPRAAKHAVVSVGAAFSDA